MWRKERDSETDSAIVLIDAFSSCDFVPGDMLAVEGNANRFPEQSAPWAPVTTLHDGIVTIEAYPGTQIVPVKDDFPGAADERIDCVEIIRA